MNSTKFFKILQLIGSLVGIAVVASAAYFGYGFYKEYKASQKPQQELHQPATQTPKAPEVAGAEIKQGADIDLETIIKQTKDEKEPLDKQANPTQNVKTPTPIKLAPKDPNKKPKKPLLAIIMDDMAYKSQLMELQKLNLPITPSFFPVSPDSPDTAKLAASVPFYMVHLPLEAQTPQQSRQQWILAGSSQAQIYARIESIKRDFPRLMFINNHTGSKFTASEADMRSLLAVLGEFGIEFVDSRTSADTAVPKIYKQANRPLLARDVFLDNTPSISYTTNQLKLAIKTAKKKGYAIAICHPHQSTFKALANAKHSLFKEVELVYIKDLPLARTILARNLSHKQNTTPNATAQTNPTIAQIFNETEIPQTATNTGDIDKSNKPSTYNPLAESNPDALPHNAYLEPDNTGEMNDENTPNSKGEGEGIAVQGADETNGATQGGIANSAGKIDESGVIANASNTPLTPPISQAPQEIPNPMATNPAESSAKNVANAPKPKPSRIDKTMFQEAKRQAKEREQAVKPRPKAQTQKPKPKTFESIKDCEQSEVEAFISGCPSDRNPQKKGQKQEFINIEWSSDQKSDKASQNSTKPATKKPKDFLHASDM